MFFLGIDACVGLMFCLKFAKVREIGLCFQGRSHTAVRTKRQFSPGVLQKQWHCIGSEERKVFQLPYLNPGWISVVFLIHHSTSQKFRDRLKMLSRIKHLFLIAAGRPPSWVSAVVQLQVSDGKPWAFYRAVWEVCWFNTRVRIPARRLPCGPLLLGGI